MSFGVHLPTSTAFYIRSYIHTYEFVWLLLCKDWLVEGKGGGNGGGKERIGKGKGRGEAFSSAPHPTTLFYPVLHNPTQHSTT